MADKAFLVGINDYAYIGDLRGCVNDTLLMEKLLLDQFHFKKANIDKKLNKDATKDNIQAGWKWLLDGAKPGDRLVFHFSGHGSYTVDLDDEQWEADGTDELLCLYDMDWNNPDSYLLDDEIADWTRQIPSGVDVTFVFDCCHSGTGTRNVPPQSTRNVTGDILKGLESLDTIAYKRYYQSRSVATSRSAERIPGLNPLSSKQVDQDSVLARFARPPAAIEAAISEKTKHKTVRQSLQSRSLRDGNELNHVLWAGCRDDQTSADAYIKDDFYGAFTYHFCEVVREHAPSTDSKTVIKKVRSKLRDGNFLQVPQLEPEEIRSTVFNVGVSGRPHRIEQEETIEQTPQMFESLRGVIVDPVDLEQLLKLVKKITHNIEEVDTDLRSRDAGKRAVVYIHGICKHAPDYSRPWWNSLAKHLTDDLRSELGATRKEVHWSHHVTSQRRSVTEYIDPKELDQLQATMRAVLEDRVSREASEQISEAQRTRSGDQESSPQVNRALLGIPGLDCVDDFMKYLLSDRIREQVISEATRVLIPLLAEGREIELFSHSWGTIVAYEALHALEGQGLTGRIHNWFTIGSALAISMIAKRVQPRSGAKPFLVKNWINLDAKGDPVGGSIAATGMKPTFEYLRLEPVGCSSILGIVSPACAHSSYFHTDNHKVNRDIFAKWIHSS